MFLPLLLKTDGLRCLLIGGGQVAARKLEMLARAGCRITVEAPDLCPAVRALVESGAADFIGREYRRGDCRGYGLVVAATERREVNRAVFEEARSLGIPVNVVDDPELCTAIFPAAWREGPLVLAVSTGGTAPFLAAALRDRLAGQCSGMGAWAAAAGRFRQAVRKAVPDPQARQRLYRLFPPQGEAAGTPDSLELGEWLAWLDRIRARE